MKKLLVAVIVLSLAVACKKEVGKPVPSEIDTITRVQPKDSATIAKEKIKKEGELKKVNDEVLQALKAKDYKTFASFIHPEKGISFSMYAFVDPKADKHFSKEDFEKYQPTKTLFTWGAMDGSGDPYKATINDYLGKWVFAADFTASQYSQGKFIGGGNSLNNLEKIYPNKDFTENYIKGTEEKSDMDWKTLRMVFEEFQGKYYLIAVVNDQWTI
ncbi:MULTISPECIES: hypothetical protein [unclassified Chryseobacterium]|uniref:hypothetical protein n=1 Tax=unclassified Chryseobacterium TaxID=2593645 RepID=UPI00100BD08B|nr:MULTISPECIES: hypothetical protein [unclassified Chryseobacterium]RXM51562.1 hypothetical protein BOQ64_11530 [Chryseobacterium sp. CH25]RXM67134.1 hypothetical protein BOQ60_04240 [Chryseobacterium sp. CH1]